MCLKYTFEDHSSLNGGGGKIVWDADEATHPIVYCEPDMGRYLQLLQHSFMEREKGRCDNGANLGVGAVKKVC